MRQSKPSSTTRTVVGQDRLKWRSENSCLRRFHGSRSTPLATIEPDPKYACMYRIRFPNGGLSDMLNLTRAKDAAVGFALRSLNSPPQEMPSKAAHVHKKQTKVVKPQPTVNRLHEARNGFLAEDWS